MYNNVLRIHNEHLANAQSVPSNSNVLGNGGAKRLSGLQGKAEVLLCAHGSLSLTASSELSLTLEHSDSDDASAFSAMPQQFHKTFSSALHAEDGEIIALLSVPSTAKRYVQARVTVDGTATGKMDIFVNYLPS